MPPKAKITKEMVVEAAFEIAREAGWECISARAVAERLNCSTQPIMYHFATVDGLKKAAYARADSFHSEYLMNVRGPQVMLEIGLNYIRFAVEEPRLFRFLFQSNYFAGTTLLEMIDAEELMPVLSAMQAAIGGSISQIKEIFVTVFLFAHGYASIIANNSLKYDENIIKLQFERAYRGAKAAASEERNG